MVQNAPAVHDIKQTVFFRVCIENAFLLDGPLSIKGPEYPMKKKILFISYALPPYLYPQSIQIGRSLNDLKKIYDVHILCEV